MPTELSFQRAFSDTADFRHIELLRANNVVDPQISQLGWALVAECESGFSSGRLYGESLALALTSRLLAKFATRSLNQRNCKGGLPLWRLRQVLQYIDDNLDTDLSLPDLASIAKISEFYFCRLFKQSMGVSPHRYIMQQRINRAYEMLKNKAIPISEISAKLGFGDQAHFTTAFKKATSMTPKQFQNKI